MRGLKINKQTQGRDYPLAPTPLTLQDEIIKSEILRDSESKLKSMQEKRKKEKDSIRQDPIKKDAMKNAGESLRKNSEKYI